MNPSNYTPVDIEGARRRKAELVDPSNIDRLPPHCDKTEQAVLGCIFLAPERADEMLAKLSPGMFFNLAHVEVFKALLAVREEGKPIDPITVMYALERTGNLQDAGGLAYLSGLPDAASNPGNFGTYLAILQDRYRRRVAVSALHRGISIAYDGSQDAESLLFELESSLRSLAHDSSGALPEIADACTLLKDKPQTPPELIHGLLHRGSKMVVGGGSKSMKTWMLLDASVSVASGEPWLLIGTTEGKVLFVNLELPEWSIAHRIDVICRAKHLTPKPGQLEVWNLRGHCASFDVLLPKIRTRIRQSDYSLIVFDPIYKLLGDLDENRAGDIGKLLNEVEHLACGTGAAVAFAAHFAKGNAARKESIDRISGSGVFARDPDTIVTMTHHEQDGAFTVEATLRNFKPIEPFVVRWGFPLMRRADTLDPARLKQPKAGKTTCYTKEMLLDLLPKMGATSSEWQKLVSEETGMARRTFYGLRQILEKNNAITRDAHDKWTKTNASAGSATTT